MINLTPSEDKTIKDFGDEWHRFDQLNLPKEEINIITQRYFNIFPFEKISKNSIGFDLGCGSGRFSGFIADKVKKLYCIEPSRSIEIAKKNLKDHKNCIFFQENIENLSLEDGSMDFGFALGVLHHTSNPQKGILKCSKKLKIGAPFLIYLYYSLDHKPFWFKFIWCISNLLRVTISIFPKRIKFLIADIFACLFYYPLAKISKFFEHFFNFNVENIPLSSYRNLSFYTMRTDSLDRMGTNIEKRFSKKEVEIMLLECGFQNISFSSDVPSWVAICYKK
jgi:SAM-dependent methyltransferase